MWNKPLATWLCCLMVLVLAGSCKSKKGVTAGPAKVVNSEETAKANLLKSIEANQNDLTYLTCRGKLNYTDPEQKADLDVVITMEKDRYIYLSVSALLGLNVARVLATHDSLVIIDLLHRKAIITNYDYVRRMSNVPLTFTQLQNLILGNAPFKHELQTIITDTVMQQVYVMQALSATQTQSVAYDLKSLKPQQTKVAERNRSKEFSIAYANPIQHQSYSYPTQLNINIRAEKNVQCVFELTNFAFEKKKDIVFSIPKTFEISRP